MVGLQPFDQVWHAAQIMGLPGQQAEVSQVPKGVCESQYLCCDAATRFPYGLTLSPPLAPCPARWTLTMEPSIIAYSKSGLAAKALNMR